MAKENGRKPGPATQPSSGDTHTLGEKPSPTSGASGQKPGHPLRPSTGDTLTNAKKR